MKSLIKRLTDTSSGGKQLPCFTRYIMSYISGYNHDKYWKRREALVNPQSGVNSLLKIYYLLWIKRVDKKQHCSFGTGFNSGASFATPPFLPHGPNGIIVGNDAKIGSNVTIYHQVTIPAGGVVVGDKTTFFPGAKVIEGVKIGSNCTIGANVVVCEDIPDYSTVVPSKARIILKDKKNDIINGDETTPI